MALGVSSVVFPRLNSSDPVFVTVCGAGVVPKDGAGGAAGVCAVAFCDDEVNMPGEMLFACESFKLLKMLDPKAVPLELFATEEPKRPAVVLSSFFCPTPNPAKGFDVVVLSGFDAPKEKPDAGAGVD